MKKKKNITQTQSSEVLLRGEGGEGTRDRKGEEEEEEEKVERKGVRFAGRGSEEEEGRETQETHTL